MLDTGYKEAVLTPRQMAVLRQLVEGKTSIEIGQALGISPKTADAHRAEIYVRTGTHNLAQLTRWAIRQGIIEP